MLGFRLFQCLPNHLGSSVEVIVSIVIEHSNRNFRYFPFFLRSDLARIDCLRAFLHGELSWTDDEQHYGPLVEIPEIFLLDDRLRLDLNPMHIDGL